MTVTFQPSLLAGSIDAPPSKSMAHRYLIGAALSGKTCTLSGVDYSQDILASMDCLRALGAEVRTQSDRVQIRPGQFLTCEPGILDCRESGSTLRFFIPLALCLGRPVTLRGSARLMERPLTVYETLCRERGFRLERNGDRLTLCGSLTPGEYTLRGDVSSQFITGLVFALVQLGGGSVIRILPPFESRSYVELTLSALGAFGADVAFTDPYTIRVGNAQLAGFDGAIEGDYSNAAFLEGFTCLGGAVQVGNLKPDSLQGDRVYRDYFAAICQGTPTLDISDCPDLGPVLIALAAMHNGARLTGTDRLRIKESDRGMAMDRELRKLGGGLVLEDNAITVPKQTLAYRGEPIQGHNDHRIVMAMSLVLSRLGGTLEGAEAVSKSYPGFFRDMEALGGRLAVTGDSAVAPTAHDR